MRLFHHHNERNCEIFSVQKFHFIEVVWFQRNITKNKLRCHV